ncbi:MAG TPA: SDR family NAD(P)-dependent oxidoreductase [Acidimicrobiia bacterium]|nr:SDR family NAD(P)-dependent oxidoreductase [Acidimicrobiia bacterium]
MSDLAVVTGAGRGIGREIALAFAAAGFDLVLAARSTGELEVVAGEVVEEGVKALVVATDLRRTGDIERLVRSSEDFGTVQVLVNNSGIAGPSGMLWELDPADWEETMAVNLTAVFLACRGFLPGMIERRSGSIINIGSITGKKPLLGRTPYAATKIGLVGLTRTLALEVGPYGIRVNLISPGFVAGPRIDRVIDMQAAARGATADEVRADFEAQSPLGRMTQPAEVASAAVFLASEAAGGITGADLNVNAGVVMY